MESEQHLNQLEFINSKSLQIAHIMNTARSENQVENSRTRIVHIWGEICNYVNSLTPNPEQREELRNHARKTWENSLVF
jgi:hypothetical protein